MEMILMLNDFDNKISSIKEVLSNLPKNNIKNKKKYLDTVKLNKDEYLRYKDLIYKELVNRYNSILSVKRNDNIDRYKNDIDNMLENICYTNQYYTSYELSGLDRILFDLSHFYKGNLDRVHKDIDSAIKCFASANIKLEAKDFNFSRYTSEYMDYFIRCYNNGDVDTLKEKFSNIYWKCPDIIFHIEVNFKYLYWKNKKKFDNYYNMRKKEVFNKYNNNCLEYLNHYYEIKKSYDKEIFEDKYLLIDSFINNINNVSDYNDSKNSKNLEDLVSSYNSDMDINYSNIFSLYYSLIEYKGIMEVSNIIDKVKELYANKNQYKNVLKTKYKDISKLEGKLFSLNKKVNSKCLFKKKTDSYIENMDISIDNTIMEIKKLYDNLDFDRFYDMVSMLEDNASYYDILLLVRSNYIFLRSIYKEENDDVTNEYINDMILKLDELLLSPYNTIIDNIFINNNKDIGLIISDRYKLMSFNINSDMLDINNIDSIINTCKKILVYKSIKDNNINIEDMSFICEAKNNIDC